MSRKIMQCYCCTKNASDVNPLKCVRIVRQLCGSRNCYAIDCRIMERIRQAEALQRIEFFVERAHIVPLLLDANNELSRIASPLTFPK